MRFSCTETRGERDASTWKPTASTISPTMVPTTRRNCQSHSPTMVPTTRRNCQSHSPTKVPTTHRNCQSHSPTKVPTTYRNCQLHNPTMVSNTRSAAASIQLLSTVKCYCIVHLLAHTTQCSCSPYILHINQQMFAGGQGYVGESQNGN